MQLPVISTQSLGSEECYNNKNHKNLLSLEFDIISDFPVSYKSERKEERKGVNVNWCRFPFSDR